mgnify:CR=1 FL=1
MSTRDTRLVTQRSAVLPTSRQRTWQSSMSIETGKGEADD